MKHLVTTFADVSLRDAHRQLSEAHDFLVARCLDAMAAVPKPGSLWGIQMKRFPVDLNTASRPAIVRKDAERLGEVINMVATLERLIPALHWFQEHAEFCALRVAECHPSTSSQKGSNDLMLRDEAGRVVVRCEVCDVASSSAGQNSKERKDIKSLGCTNGVPTDGMRRFICTSPEFARAIQSAKRKWKTRQYRYREFALGDQGDTVLVELVSVLSCTRADGGEAAGQV